MINLVPAHQLIRLTQDHPDAYFALKLKCCQCGSISKDDWGWDDSDIGVVIEVMGNAPETFDYSMFAGSIFCPPCLERFKKEACLHQHPVDNHFCLKLKHRGGDHECCKRHMFY